MAHEPVLVAHTVHTQTASASARAAGLSRLALVDLRCAETKQVIYRGLRSAKTWLDFPCQRIYPEATSERTWSKISWIAEDSVDVPGQEIRCVVVVVARE
jgi:hypothetical protein